MTKAPQGKQNHGLGKGLSALLGENVTPINQALKDTDAPADGGAQTIPLNKIKPSSLQPRQHFNEEELKELSESIKQHGVVQPILLREIGEEGFEIVAGERRFRAAGLAGLKEIPAIVLELDDKGVLEIALIENVQRTNLLPLELSEGYQRLMDEFGYSQEALADAIGKSRSYIANTLRLNTLPEAVKELLNEEKLSAGHGRALIAAEDPEFLATEVVKKGLNVRQTEALVNDSSDLPKQRSSKKAKALKEKSADIAQMEKMLSEALGLAISIEDKNNRGFVKIAYHSVEELDKILRRLDK